MENDARKKTIAKLAAALLAALLLCTAVSRQVYRMLLPTVELTPIERKTLTDRIEASGELTYTELMPIRADGTYKVLKCDLKEGVKLEENAELLTFDVTEPEAAEKRLSLTVKEYANQLLPNLSSEKREQLLKQLDMAQTELKLHRQSYPEGGIIRAERDGYYTAWLKAPETVYFEGQAVYTGEGEEALPVYRESGANYKKGDYLYSLNTHAFFAPTDWTVTEHIARTGDFVREGDALFRIDIDRASLTGGKLELSVMQLESQLYTDTGDAARDVLRMRLELAQDELKRHRAAYPEDGMLRATHAGTLVKWNVQEGDTLTKDQILGFTIDESARRAVQWTLSAEAGAEISLDTEVRIELLSAKPSTAYALVSAKRFDMDTGRWTFVAALDEEDVEGLSESVRAQVIIESGAIEYSHTVPVACLNQDANGRDFIYVVELREGLFSKENVVRKLSVNVLDKNGLYAAVTEGDNFRKVKYVVRYSTHPVYDGKVVKVVS